MSRRGAQEGTIRQRADGRWEARIHLGYGDGRRLRRSFYGKTRREVQEKLARANRDHGDGRALPPERLTVGTFLADWLVAVKSTIRPSTWRSYEMNVRVHIVPTLGRTPLARLSPQQVQALVAAKLTSGLAPRTVQYVHAILRRALGTAEKWGLASRNVARLVDPPRVRREETLWLDDDQARAFVLAIRGHRLEALFTTAVAIGLRQGEALGLRWSDIDLDSGLLSVRHTLVPMPRDMRADEGRRGTRLVLAEPKTARSRRTIALPGVVAAALRDHRRRQAAERLWAGSRWDDHDFVFTSTVGTPLDSRNVTHELQRALVAAGLPRLRFHDLRHTAASLLLAQGVHPRVVMEMLGHSTFAMTMNVYSHVIPALGRDAADRMDALLTAV